MIHVCSLARLSDTVQETRARHLVSLIGDEARIERPNGIAPENHLWLRLHDISSPLDGYIMPDQTHIADLITFIQGWDRHAPLVIHCYMGISRSTASAFVGVCALNPHRDELAIAQTLRQASPTACWAATAAWLPRSKRSGAARLPTKRRRSALRSSDYSSIAGRSDGRDDATGVGRGRSELLAVSWARGLRWWKSQ